MLTPFFSNTGEALREREDLGILKGGGGEMVGCLLGNFIDGTFLGVEDVINLQNTVTHIIH